MNAPVKVDLGVWSWLRWLVVWLLVAAALVGLVVWFVPLIKDHRAHQSRLYQVRQEILQEQQLTNSLTAQILSFNRPETIEWLARTLANHARTNEVVFQFADE